jgi:hemoglobin
VVTGSQRDLDSRTEIHDLVVAFYREVALDDLLGPVFGEVVDVDWSVHIPKLIDYWCRVLLREPCYAGLILASHREVHDVQALRPELFDRWFGLFVAVIDERWGGPTAERAKAHAAQMAATLARLILGIDWKVPGCASRSSDRPASQRQADDRLQVRRAAVVCVGAPASAPCRRG